MKKILLIFILVFAAVLVTAKDITVYHTSDTHGYYFPLVNRKGKQQGGAAALASFLKRDGGGKNYMLLDGGDFAQGNIESNETKGMSSVGVFNYLGYDAVTLGNHEFDFGDGLNSITAGLEADILAANFLSAPGVKAYKIYEIEGVKIAVLGIGLTGDRNKSYKEEDIKEVYSAAMREIAGQKSAAVILLMHAGNHDGRGNISPRGLVESFNYPVAAAFGGHTHYLGIDKTPGTLYVESGDRFQNVAKVVLSFDDNTGVFTGASAKLVELLTTNGEDEETKKFLDTIRNKEADKIVCTAKYCFYSKSGNPSRLDNQLADFTADLILERAGAEIAVINAKMIRSGVPKGLVRQRDIMQAMPFSDTIVSFEADGRLVEDAVKKSLQSDYSLFQYAGMRIDAVFENKQLKTLKIKVNGEPLDYNKKYKIAAHSYLMNYPAEENEPFKRIEPRGVREYEEDIKQLFIRSLPNGKPPKANRITVKNK